MPQTYGSSHLDGYDFSRIKAFCDFFFIGLPDNAGNGDLLSYDAVSKLWRASQAACESFCAYSATAAITLTTGTTDFIYDRELYKGSSFSHTTGTPGVTILRSGIYLLQADVGLAVTAGSTNSYSNIWLALNGVELPGCRSQLYTFQSGFHGAVSINHLLALDSGDVIKLQGQLSASGNTVSTVANTNRMSLIMISKRTTGNVGQAMGGGLFSFITYP